MTRSFKTPRTKKILEAQKAMRVREIEIAGGDLILRYTADEPDVTIVVRDADSAKLAGVLLLDSEVGALVAALTKIHREQAA